MSRARWVEVDGDTRHFHYEDGAETLGCVVVEWVLDEVTQYLVSKLSFTPDTPEHAQREFAAALNLAVSGAGGALVYARDPVVGSHDDSVN